MKRLLREAFRILRPELPAAAGQGLDVVVTVRPHHRLPFPSYQRLLADLVGRARRDLANKREGTGDGEA